MKKLWIPLAAIGVVLVAVVLVLYILGKSSHNFPLLPEVNYGISRNEIVTKFGPPEQIADDFCDTEDDALYYTLPVLGVEATVRFLVCTVNDSLVEIDVIWALANAAEAHAQFDLADRELRNFFHWKGFLSDTEVVPIGEADMSYVYQYGTAENGQRYKLTIDGNQVYFSGRQYG